MKSTISKPLDFVSQPNLRKLLVANSDSFLTNPKSLIQNHRGLPMRILHLLNDIRELGNGIINVAVDLACLQAKAGYEVAVASAGGEYEALLAQYGVRHFHLNQQR